MNVHSNDQSLGNSYIGDHCNRIDEGLAQGGMLAVKMEKKSLVDILKKLKNWGIFCIISQDAYGCNKRKLK